MKNNKKTIYSALTVVTALLAQLPATAQETADSAMVNVAFKKAQKSDVLGGVSTVDVRELTEKNYNTYSLDNMQGYVSGYNGNGGPMMGKPMTMEEAAKAVVLAFLIPFFIGEVGMQAVFTAIVGYTHIHAIPLTHQFTTFRTSSASSVSVPPIVHQRLCYNVFACVLIPLVKIECSELLQLLLIEELFVCATHCLSQSAQNRLNCCHAILFFLPFVDFFYFWDG